MKRIGPPWPVLLLVRELGIGGCERDLTKIAKGLDRTRFQPHVGCFQSEGFRTSELKDAGVPIVQFPVTSFASLSALAGAWRFRNYVRKHTIQLVHAFDVPMDLFAVPAARMFGVPAVVASQLSYRWTYQPLYQRLLRLADRFAQVIVVNSCAVRDHLLREEQIPSDHIYVCHNGIESDVFFPSSAHPAIRGSAPLIIGTICALREGKRVNLLLDAFAKVRRLQPGMRLLIVGSGPMLADLQAQATRLSLAGNCTFEPATRDVAGWLSALDIFVLSSSSESFPNTLLEAMACGCCVVASRVGGVPELVSDGVDGLLFQVGNSDELAQKLSAVIRDRDLRQRLAATAVETAHTRFPIEKTMARTQALYEALLKGRPLPQ